MAYTTLNTTTGFSFARVLSNIKTGYIRWVENVADRRMEPYQLRIAELKALSDAELEKKGLRREEIEMRVLGRFFYC